MTHSTTTMEPKNKLFSITGKVQHYQWGGYDYIPRLLGIHNDKHQPFAEYWLGAHQNAPALLPDGTSLDKFIQARPAVLGDKTKQAFGRLPYLLKILDVRDMLSIQVHPNKKAAVNDFEQENKKGIPLNAASRNYKDDNHKPELMTALSDDFWLLHGFLAPEKLVATVQAVPGFGFMLPVFAGGNYKALYELIMTMDQLQVNNILQPLLDSIIPLYQQNKLAKESPDFWAARAALTFNEKDKIDRGIFSIYLFNILHLKKGEAVFQDAGILHAYLEGQNVEIMANSDNVLRGGLTPKHIDVAELMKHVVFEPVIPQIILGKPVSDTEIVFLTPAPDFELRRISLSARQESKLHIQSVDLFLVLNGSIEVVSESTSITVGKGEAFAAVDYAVLSLKAFGEPAEIFRATVPLKV